MGDITDGVTLEWLENCLYLLPKISNCRLVMQISNLFQSLGVNKAFTPKQEELTSTPVSMQQANLTSSQEIANKYDVKNISYGELKELANELRGSGVISNKTSSVLSGTVITMQQLSGATDTDKINALDQFEGMADFIKNNLGESEVKYIGTIMDALRGIDASKNSTIPPFV